VRPASGWKADSGAGPGCRPGAGCTPPHGMSCSSPPTPTTIPSWGDSSYPPGTKRTPASSATPPRIMIAEAVVGHGDRAQISICASPRRHGSHQRGSSREPYVYAQMSPDGMHRPRRAKNSWLTGTAAWTGRHHPMDPGHPPHRSWFDRAPVVHLVTGFTAQESFPGVTYVITGGARARQ
jgi:hypothetical protein